MKKKRRREEDDKKVKRIKIKTSPMLGRRISFEDRHPNAPKLGRKFKYAKDVKTERHVVTLLLRAGDMEEFMKKVKARCKADAICKIVERILK